MAGGMKLVSLFAGCGGFDLGFARAGIAPVAHVEIDPQCRRVLAKHWPNAVSLDDVRAAGAHNLPTCDVLTFGFPCQDLSVAGKRAGITGSRSGLFYEATRIINELRPALIVWENVPGLLSSGQGHDFLACLTELRRIGYNGGWRTLDAQYFGVAQRRRRIFGVFARRDIGAERCAEILSLREGVRWHPAPSREARQGAATPFASCATSYGGCREGVGTLRAEGGDAGHGSETLVASTGVISHCLNADAMGRIDYETETFITHALTGSGHDASEDGTGRGTPIVTTLAIRGRNGQPALECRDDGLANAVLTPNGGRGGIGVGAVAFTPGNLTRGAGASPSVTTVQTLKADSGRGTSDQQPHVMFGSSVRRLTPTECCRLQGFPDDWFDGVNLADGPRYRMLGNAVCVNVSEWIARRIVATLA